MVPLPAVSLGLTTSPGRQQVSTVSSPLYGGAAAAVIALHLTTNRTLGFHTDELHYLDSGRHPAFGYVDFPPHRPAAGSIGRSTGLRNTETIPISHTGMRKKPAAPASRPIGGQRSAIAAAIHGYLVRSSDRSGRVLFLRGPDHAA